MFHEVLERTGIPSDGISVIHLNRSITSEVHLASLVFLPPQTYPSMIIKSTTDHISALSFKDEFETLSRFRDCDNAGLSTSVSAPLCLLEKDGLSMFAQAGLPGTTMSSFPSDRYFKSKRFQRHFASIVQWVYLLHSRFGTASIELSDNDRQLLLLQPIADYRRIFTVSPALDTLLDETAATLSQTRVPLTPWHGDFCTSNILIGRRGRISVIDWEYPFVNTWPLCDLLHFMTSIFCVPSTAGAEVLPENYGRLFFQRTEFSALLNTWIKWYFDKLSLHVDLLLPLSVMAWVLHAIRKAEFIEASGLSIGDDPREAPRPLTMFRDSACVNLEMIAAHRDDYFKIDARR
jgi:thiamine kinase-like enzyme